MGQNHLHRIHIRRINHLFAEHPVLFHMDVDGTETAGQAAHAVLVRRHDGGIKEIGIVKNRKAHCGAGHRLSGFVLHGNL